MQGPPATLRVPNGKQEATFQQGVAGSAFRFRD